MSRTFKAVFFLLLPVACFLYSSCKKEQAISTTPSIKFVSVAPNPAIKYQDTIKIVVSYTDGDGDLGVDSADAKNLFVTDSRNNVTSQFRIPQLAPDNANIIIEGNLDIILPPQGFIDDNDNSESVTYSIYVVDRAGHKSNTVQTTALTINKQ
jgi:hypothetical protein